MKRKIVFSLFVTLCAAFVSCNRGAELEGFDPNTERDVVLQATMEQDAATRAASLTQEGVAVSWAENDILDLVFENEVVSQLRVTAINGNTAQLAGKVKGAYPKNTEFTLYYGGTNYDYTGQTGTAASAASKAYLQGTVRISKQDNEILTLGSAVLKHQQAYVSFTFRYGPDELPIKSVTVTPASASIVKTRELGDNPVCFAGTSEDSFTVNAGSTGLSTVYFAISDMATTASTAYDFAIVAEWNGSDTTFLASNSKHFQNGKYYMNTEVVLKKKSDAIATLPAAVTGLMYDTQEHALITPAEMNEGAKIYYAVTDVIATDLPSETVWSEEVPERTEPGSYMVWYKVEGGKFYEDMPASYDEATFVDVVIAKRPVAITKPTAVTGLKYTGSAQALVNAGSVKDGVNENFDSGLQMEYYVYEGEEAPSILDYVTWTTGIPNGTNAGKYYIFYRVNGAPHYEDVNIPYDGSNYPYLTVTISKSDAVIANPEPIVNLIYNGDYQQLVLPADASDGCKVYYHVHESDVDRSVIEAMNASDDWSTEVPMRKNAGTYYVWTKVVDESGAGNYSGITESGISAAAVVTSIAKADLTVQVPTLKNWTYDGAQHNLVNDTLRVRFTGVNGTVDALKEEVPAVLSFKVNDGSWTAYDPAAPVLPSATNAGTYAVSYKVDGGRNFKSINATSIGNAEVSKATITVSVAPAKVDNWDYDGTAHALIDPTGTFSYAGASNTDPLDTSEPVPAVLSFQVNGGEWSTTVPTATNAGTYALKYKVEGGTNFVSIGATDLGSVVVNKANAVIDSAPQGATGLTYNSLDKHLLSAAGVTSISTIADNHTPVMWYKVADSQPATPADNGFTAAGWSNNYLADALVGTDAGTYKIWYAVQGASNYNGVAVSSSSYVEVEIESSSATVTKPVGAENLVYSASAQELLTSAGSGEGTVYYFVTTTPDYDITGTTPISNPSDWYTDYQDIKGTDSGTYYVWVYAGGNTNYSAAYSDVAVEVVIAKAAGPAADISYSTVSPASSAIATDGGIGNLNDTGVWEYSTDDGTTWTDITSSSITGLAPIMVKIRVKETANYLAGAAQRIDVPQYYSVPEGAISGVFSVSESKKIFFSKGNLQYIGSASTPYWKFANHQYDYLGNNGQGSDSETVDRDFFGWGTGNAPNKVSTASDQYTVFTDWGTNAISNGGNTANFGWYTMSASEWGGIAGSSRYTFSGVRYAKATVAGVPGMIFFPDTWSRSYFDVTSFNNDTVGFTVNIITEDDWNNKFELNGAVFLPAAGIRNHTTVSNTGEWGYYWESNVASYQTSTACALWFYSNNMIIYNARPWSYGYSVRLAIAVPQSSSAGLDNYIVNTPQVW